MASENIQSASDKFHRAKNGMEYFNVLSRKGNESTKEFVDLLIKQSELFKNETQNELLIIENCKKLTELITE